jgi:uncharacterized protein
MVSAVFADACYFVALCIRRDRLHRQAFTLHASLNQRLLTTEWVLTEVATALAAPATRSRFADLIKQLGARDDVTVIPVSSEQFHAGCALYLQRMDKGWSLTDCISFLVMRQNGVKSALTSDKHFAQAGFRILMGVEPAGVAEVAPVYGGQTSPPTVCQPDQVRNAA